MGLRVDAQAGSPRILKVLPQYLDLQGRHSLSPSLYERDAYQALLRKNPARCSGIRYAVQWKARGMSTEGMTVRIELRTGNKNDVKPLVKEQPIGHKGVFSHWSNVIIDGDAFKEMGEVIAWRATLWQEGKQIAEQKSFLW